MDLECRAHRFHALSVAIEVVEVLGPVVARTRAADRDLGEQLRRALSSIALNIAEGQQPGRAPHRPLLHGCGVHRRVAGRTSPSGRLGLHHRQRYPGRRKTPRPRRRHAASARHSLLSAMASESVSAFGVGRRRSVSVVGVGVRVRFRVPMADGRRPTSKSRKPAPSSDFRRPVPASQADPQGDYSSLTAESDVSVGRGAGGANRSSSPSTITLSCLYAGRPVPAGIRRPMMTFSLRPRR